MGQDRGMGVELTFAMSTDSSASMRVQSMLLPYDDRFENRWRACHPTVWQVGHDAAEV
jgi:hypothetical protein